jgi:hypothetical protein
MIIGRYAIAPSSVQYGSMYYDEEVEKYKVIIGLGEGAELVQYVVKKDAATAMLAHIEECIIVHEDIVQRALENGGE